jgi:hypothetical protein
VDNVCIDKNRRYGKIEELFKKKEEYFGEVSYMWNVRIG